MDAGLLVDENAIGLVPDLLLDFDLLTTVNVKMFFHLLLRIREDLGVINCLSHLLRRNMAIFNQFFFLHCTFIHCLYHIIS